MAFSILSPLGTPTIARCNFITAAVMISVIIAHINGMSTHIEYETLILARCGSGDERGRNSCEGHFRDSGNGLMMVSQALMGSVRSVPRRKLEAELRQRPMSPERKIEVYTSEARI
ncbi:hypothetical protein NDU88_000847 [Pleurodeles waltl]|uniref:Uncharacterized protein n=1 Tax=Pleurodeles waltl TaxID=8319 RepID=A0AAV7P240_PLEWA|nr:hypothetical protein NDU88_000847 [Pleurodeles waltl]